MQIIATLTEIRKDGMQKWEQDNVSKDKAERYIWLAPFQSLIGAELNCKAELAFHSGTAGMVGGHWSLWKVVKLIG